MDQNLALVMTAVVIMLVSMMGIASYNDIRMAEAGLQQCKVTSNGYTSTIWQKTCQTQQNG